LKLQSLFSRAGEANRREYTPVFAFPLCALVLETMRFLTVRRKILSGV